MQLRHFVIEAIMAASYGQLLAPGIPVQYYVPYTSIMELYELLDCEEQIMLDEEEDKIVKQNIDSFLDFCEQPLNRKKIEKALQSPWKRSAPLLVNEHVSFVIINALDLEQYGESFDPIETELILIAVREQTPLLTDQLDFIKRMIEQDVPVHVFDVVDFEYALETFLKII